MKKNTLALIAFSLTLFLAACSKNLSDTSTSIPDPLPPIDTTNSSILYEGRFENGPFGTTTGKVSIISTGGQLALRLDSFRVSSGPDLKVYISKQRQPLDFYRLGSLKAFEGSQEYTISVTPNFSEYNYVLIHCEKFNHLFGAAVLMKK